jgi:hypothetical protein
MEENILDRPNCISAGQRIRAPIFVLNPKFHRRV